MFQVLLRILTFAGTVHYVACVGTYNDTGCAIPVVNLMKQFTIVIYDSRVVLTRKLP